MIENSKTNIMEQTNVRFSKRKIVLITILSIALLFVISVFVYQILNSDKDSASAGKIIANPRSYIGKIAQMKQTIPVVKDGMISISFSELDKFNIVKFEINNSQGFSVPVMAYISSQGRIFEGVALCECTSNEFFLAGKTIVCKKCRTTYSMEDQKYLSGSKASGKYPPFNLNPELKDGMVVIDHSLILDWRMRTSK